MPEDDCVEDIGYFDFMLGLGVTIGIIWVYGGAVLPHRDYFFEFDFAKFGIGGGSGGKAILFCVCCCGIIGIGGGVGIGGGITIGFTGIAFDISGAFISYDESESDLSPPSRISFNFNNLAFTFLIAIFLCRSYSVYYFYFL